jgi:ribosome-binding factor A
MTRRMERVNVVLRQEISRVLATDLRDPRLSSLVSVTRVEATADLRSAKAYVSVLGDREEKSGTLTALTSASGFVRRRIRQHVTLRSVPSIAFYIDESIEQGADVLKLINEVAPGPEDSGTK